MKKIYAVQFACSLLIILLGNTVAPAQGGVYFRENFANGTGPTSDPGASSTPTDYTGENGLVWKFYGVYLTSGTSCTDVPGTTGGSNRHIRSTNNSGITDTAYTILPDVTAGIYSVSIQRSRANRRFTFWINNNNTTDPADGGWVLANVTVKSTSSPAVLCQDTTIMINSATARRLMIKFERNGNSDIDSIELTSVGSLPAKFGSITLQQKNDVVIANWNTYNESNVNGYYLQRSKDGFSFEDLSFVGAKNALEADYSASDRIKGGGVLFYRVKSVDLDGKQGFSPVAKINIDKGVANGVTVVNPVRGNRIEVQLNGLVPGVYQVSLNSISGTRLNTRSVNVQNDRVIVSMDVPATAGKGMQVLTVGGSNFRYTGKVMVE
jgi:hypothetical protein